MDTRTTSRRGALAAIGASAGLLAAIPAVTAGKADAATTMADPQWQRLLAQHEAAKAQHNASIDRLAVAERSSWKAVEAFLNQPAEPLSGLPDDITPLTLKEIIAASNAPSHKQAWAQYERDMAAWKAEKASLPAVLHKEEMDSANNEAAPAHTAAFDAVVAHRATSLSVLREKLELIEAMLTLDRTAGARDAVAALLEPQQEAA